MALTGLPVPLLNGTAIKKKNIFCGFTKVNKKSVRMNLIFQTLSGKISSFYHFVLFYNYLRKCMSTVEYNLNPTYLGTTMVAVGAT